MSNHAPTSSRLACGLTALCLLALPAPPGLRAAPSPEPISPLPLEAPEDPQRVSLGERLFGDVRLSGSQRISCASCHPLTGGGADGRTRAQSSDGVRRLRNTPTMFNVRYNLYLNWDGAHESLTTHLDKLLQNPAVMGNQWPQLLDTLRGVPAYVYDFEKAYPEGLTRASVLDALASYERSLVTPNARIDRYLRGQRDALSADEQHGYQLFKAYGCVACHQGVNIGGNLVQRFGVFAVPDALGTPLEEADDGRFRVTKDPRDRAVFRVPSLRNVALTAPYFHDGRAPTLEVAVRVMGQAQLGRTLNAQDIRLITAFLRTLTGEYRGRPLDAPPEPSGRSKFAPDPAGSGARSGLDRDSLTVRVSSGEGRPQPGRDEGRPQPARRRS